MDIWGYVAPPHPSWNSCTCFYVFPLESIVKSKCMNQISTFEAAQITFCFALEIQSTNSSQIKLSLYVDVSVQIKFKTNLHQPRKRFSVFLPSDNTALYRKSGLLCNLEWLLCVVITAIHIYFVISKIVCSCWMNKGWDISSFKKFCIMLLLRCLFLRIINFANGKLFSQS